MKTLVVDDVEVNRRLVKKIVSPYGQCDQAPDSRTAVALFQKAWKEDTPYNLICLDIMMPEIDGQDLLLALRQIEKKMHVTTQQQAKIIMITACNQPHAVLSSRKRGCDAYLIKPIGTVELRHELVRLGLISEDASETES